VQDGDAGVLGPALPGRLRTARELRGLTQQAAVKRMTRPITAAALSQLEAGKVRPTEATLHELASALDVPYEFFLTQWPGSSGDEVPLTYFRDLRATSVRERRRARALTVLLNDLVAAIEVHVRLPDVRLPSFAAADQASRSDLDEYADALRSTWELGSEPIVHVVRELERHGVPVARLAFADERVDAFSVRFEKRPLVLLTNTKSNYVRSRFDASHELAHLLLHERSEPGARVIERQAHDFASSFLLPKSMALEELPRKLDAQGWARVADMKRRWGISIAALLYRARDLKVLDPDSYSNAIKYMSAKGWRTVEPGDREMGPPEAPLLIERALRTVEVSLGTPIDEFVRASHLPVDDTMALINAAVDRRPTIEL
jgi:Zn-dependent peptidase ImmA (M78 family)